MLKRHVILYTIGSALLLGAFVGYRFYDAPIETEKSGPIAESIQFEPSEEIKTVDRAFLWQEEAESQLPRDIRKRFASLKLPEWGYTPKKWGSSVSNPVKIIVLPADAVVFHAIGLPDEEMYKVRPLQEKMLPELGTLIGEEGVYIKNPPIPEDPPDVRRHFPPRHVDPDSPDRVPKSYPLIAKMIIDSDGSSLMRLEDWIELVGGEGQAQKLLEEAGWRASVPIETLIHQSTLETQGPPTNRSTQK